MAGRDPPAGEVSLRHSLEELPSAPENGAMGIAEDERGEVVDISPHRHVDDHADAVAGVEL